MSERYEKARAIEPGNCRWVSKKQNMNNKRGNVVVTYRGREVSIEDAVQMAGGVVGYATAISRIRKQGWTVADAVETAPLTQAERFSSEARAGVLARARLNGSGEARKR
ncbi:hypothetical protein LNAOJCKE_0968 [Methylorubrum aminovorans]|uniref:Uncharacterized protein n=1 Tax=Methylorubrum aminovorans TaxID=269069 RepID=A0ABQ4UDB7_9HYPH|nr:hypothetical protein [Methylorubrum aminovorans]GJE63770.1 hypothetical protein LNAOJCKE_0968 [Methylorubrum aminovorans]GMA73611.1 hypothetical protein GCM10025880_00280 [Methylorubrum aminovorans]GMA73699.1 hypothetical protein GCM10025880_01160 [Methylorubrum aminovorans]